MTAGMLPGAEFRASRDLLMALRSDYPAARARFRWPRLPTFNWALDWFDVIAAGNELPALRVIGEREDRTVSFSELSRRSDEVAAKLTALGLRRGDRIVVSLRTSAVLWELLLAAMKLGVVTVPTPARIPADQLADRVLRSRARAIVCDSEAGLPPLPAGVVQITSAALCAPGEQTAREVSGRERVRATRAGDPLMAYFTSGTTALPKLVEHSHVSYPVGHLSSFYASGLVPGDVHLNLAGPGWAKHSWSSLFVPWTAEATVLAADLPSGPGEIDVEQVLELLDRCAVTSMCAPPHVWRSLARTEPAGRALGLREATSAGEYLGRESLLVLRDRWGMTVREMYGQTETTAVLANLPGADGTRLGTAGRPLPGYDLVLVDPHTGEAADTGELCIRLDDAPPAIMTGYAEDPARTAAVLADGLYRTGDLACRDRDGFFTVMGRLDDVFKCEGHRTSPAEIEAVLALHPHVADVVVVGVPDPAGETVPHAFVQLHRGLRPGPGVAGDLFRHAGAGLATYARPRRLHFVSRLPRTSSGKARRAVLRNGVPAAACSFDAPAGSAAQRTTSDPQPIAAERQPTGEEGVRHG